MSEMINIKAQKKAINLQSDTEYNMHISRFLTKYTNRGLNILIHTVHISTEYIKCL